MTATPKTMETKEQELLLGYLLNALDEREAAQVERDLAREPRLRSELAALQRELAPLDYIADPIEPPPQLAKRTCAKIWATLDKENLDEEDQDIAPNSDAFMDSAFYSPETMAWLSFSPPELDPCESKPAVPKIRVKVEEEADEDERPASSGRLGLVASVSVGMVIAFLLFPMIRYAERSTRSYVTDSYVSDISRRIDLYEQIHGSKSSVPSVVEVPPFDLTQSNWQELRPEALVASPFMQSASAVSFEEKVARSGLMHMDNIPVSEREEGWYEPLMSDNRLLFSVLEQEVYPARAWVRSAFGQNVLIEDGRIFFRTLPRAESPEK